MTTRVYVLAAALGLMAAPVQAQQPERLTVSGERVAIYDLVGAVRIDATTGPEVVVEVTRGGRDLGQLKIERGAVESAPSYETLRVIFPSDEISYPRMGRSRTQMSIRDDGTFNDHNNDGGRRRGARRWDRKVDISGNNGGLEAWADLHVMVPAGKRVVVNLGVGDISVTNVNGNLSVDGSSGTVTASGTKGIFNVDVGSGNVTVTDAQGQLSIDTGSGNVELTTFKGTSLNIDTGSGSITATGVVADALNVDTGSGDVSLSGVTSPDIKVDTGSGEVDLDLTADANDVVVDTGSGGVTLRVPATIGAMLDIDSGSGGVESDLPLAVTRWGSDKVSGKLGDGQGRISIETGSGKVRIIKRV